jgi:hypothetical protein
MTHRIYMFLMIAALAVLFTFAVFRVAKVMQVQVAAALAHHAEAK